MHCRLSTSTTCYLNMSLCHIAHIGELHQIPAIANVVLQLALPSFCYQGGEEGGIPFSKDPAGSDSTGSQGAVGPIGGQDSPLTLNLQASITIKFCVFLLFLLLMVANTYIPSLLPLSVTFIIVVDGVSIETLLSFGTKS